MLTRTTRAPRPHTMSPTCSECNTFSICVWHQEARDTASLPTWPPSPKRPFSVTRLPSHLLLVGLLPQLERALPSLTCRAVIGWRAVGGWKRSSFIQQMLCAHVSPQGLSAEQDRHCLAFVESVITKVTSKLENIHTMKEEQVFRKYLMGETSPLRLPLTTGKTRKPLRRAYSFPGSLCGWPLLKPVLGQQMRCHKCWGSQSH